VLSYVLFVGAQTIDGTRLEIKAYHDAESNVQLVALLPDQKIMLASDLVFAPHDHVFTLAPHFDHWIGILEELKATAGYDTIVIGHDAPTDRAAYDGPTDRSAYDAPITNLRRAREIYAGATDGKTYADGLKAAFPERRQPRWVDFSGLMLYAAQPEPVK
jgi:glyoxylase-like metal-dependent hydrolase (beta-lactamase superfamily II)